MRVVTRKEDRPMRIIHVAALAVALNGTSNLASAADLSSDLVDTAIAAGSFSTLVAAVDAAGLVETLKGEGPFTVFAPTDAAFAKLPEGTLEGLLQPENRDQLIAILTYHVVPGAVPASAVVELSEVPTVNGANLSIAVEGQTVMVNDATVVATDIMTSNGIIHVVDAVLLPPQN
jgi:uncharacterized surface protein with fasciclin (FAS1) repeats